MEEKTTANAVLRCSFCNKTQNDVRRLIAGPAVFICDECVEVCVDIIVDGARFEDPPPTAAEVQRWGSVAAKLARESAVCSLCGKPGLLEDLLPIEGRGALCGECANAIEDALNRGRPLS